MSAFDLDIRLCQRRPRGGHCNAELKEIQFGNLCRLLKSLVVRSHLKEYGTRGTREYLKSNIDTAAACPCAAFFPAAGQINILASKRSQCLFGFTPWPDIGHMSKRSTGAKVSLTCVCNTGIHSDAQPFTDTQLRSQSCDLTLKMQHYFRHRRYVCHVDCDGLKVAKPT